MATRLDLLTIMVNDMQRMLAYYRDVLGFEVRRDRGGWVSLENDGVRLALWERKSLAAQHPQITFPAGVNGTFVLAITFTDRMSLSESFKRIVENGGRQISPVRDEPQWAMCSGWVADPEGNLIELTCHYT